MDTPAQIAQWLAPEVEIDLRPGGRLRLGWPERNEEASGVVEVVEPPRRLVLDEAVHER